MTNDKFLKEHNLKAPASWNDLLNPAYKNMLQMADARTSGTAVTRIFSILEVNGRDETKAFDYMKKLRPNVQLYTKSGGGGTLPVGSARRAAASSSSSTRSTPRPKGYDVTISFPKEGIGTAAEGIALIKGAKNPSSARSSSTGRRRRRCKASSRSTRSTSCPRIRRCSRAEPRRGAQGREDLSPSTPTTRGANRKRIVDRWIAEVLNP
jgi:iron(III) transport system substrate-binding protein